jgi:hypothetical protein
MSRYLIENQLRFAFIDLPHGKPVPINILAASYSVYDVMNERWLKNMDSLVEDAPSIEEYLLKRGISMSDIPTAEFVAYSTDSTRIKAAEHKPSGFYCGAGTFPDRAIKLRFVVDYQADCMKNDTDVAQLGAQIQFGLRNTLGAQAEHLGETKLLFNQQYQVKEVPYADD